jgi:hypothetical protein
VEQGSAAEQQAALARATERVLAGVAGNLAAYVFTGADGAPVAGRDAGGAGSRCGYAAAPQETVNDCAAHDNETLFDLVALKMCDVAPLAARCRVVALAQALLAWSQGVPFFHAGDELLRSKSLDRDSYNSGDWFNALDWTGARTGWGVGLPPAPKNRAHWALQRRLLADPAAAPQPAHAAAALARFQRALRVRASSPLFRLRTAADVQARLHMHNRGPDAAPGVLLWELRDGGAAGGDALPALDSRFSRLLVALNATQQQVTLPQPALAGHAWRLHPELAASEDATRHVSAAARVRAHQPRQRQFRQSRAVPVPTRGPDRKAGRLRAAEPRGWPGARSARPPPPPWTGAGFACAELSVAGCSLLMADADADAAQLKAQVTSLQEQARGGNGVGA